MYKVNFEFMHEGRDTDFKYHKDFLNNNGAGFTYEEASQLAGELKSRDNVKNVYIDEN